MAGRKCDPDPGFIYVALSARGFCKIGTTRNLRSRAKQLEEAYNAHIHYFVATIWRFGLERSIHKALDGYRILVEPPSRECYELSADDIVQKISEVADVHRIEIFDLAQLDDQLPNRWRPPDYLREFIERERWLRWRHEKVHFRPLSTTKRSRGRPAQNPIQRRAVERSRS
jgi:hypothetical protein